MDKEIKKIYLYIGIFVAIIFIGATYAFFTAGISSENSTTVKADAGTMKITYDGGANINLTGIYPRDEVWATKNITVTGNNTTEAEMYYKLTLVVDSNTFTMSDPLQYELVSTNTSSNGEVIPAISKTDITNSTYELGRGHFVKANNAKHTYLLKIYYPNKKTSQNDNQNAAFSAHVEIENVKPPKTSGTLAELILYNNEVKTPITIPGKEVSAHTLNDVESETLSVPSTYQNYYITYGTGWEANGTRFNLTGVTVTSDTYANSYSELVGKFLPSNSLSFSGSTTARELKTTTERPSIYYVISATQDNFTYKTISSNKNTTEALLASTEDDYGTSYYFRGAVKNNYVEFANKCWRIVRINGDGSIKIVLHNDNVSNAENPCSTLSNGAAFAHYEGETHKISFNTSSNDAAYVGLMYGTADSNDYASTHANINKSTILNALETWYANNLASYESKLADTIWCNDKSTVTTLPDGTAYGTGLGYKRNKTGYGAFNRINGKAPEQYANPSLICPNDNNGGKLSKFTVDDTTNGNGNLNYKIGLLTVDELAFSGSKYRTINLSIYLMENTIPFPWWTMSPEGSTGNAYVWAIASGSLIDNLYVADGSESVRPAVSLVSTIEATGIGTSENPYVIVS